LEQTLPSYKKSAAAYQKLVDDGFMGAVAAADKTREAVEKEQDLKAQAANVQSLKASIAGSEKKIAAIRSQYHSQLQDERVDTVSQLNRSQQELEKSAVKEGDTEIRAPYDGVVKDLAITTNGAVVAAGSLLMNIVPREEPLQAEVLLNNEDVGFVVVGQPAKVKIAAYPFQEYGMIDGDVALVAADSMDPKQQQNSSQQQLSYRAIVHLKSRALVSARSGEKLPLTAGMLVTTEIGEGRRTVMEYLLSPVVKTVQEAARER
jgi:HlyD family secretion protein